MAGMLRVRRSKGALSGLLLVLLGIWGALIPFVGPYFHLAFTPDRAWDATAGRMWLEVLPGVVTLGSGVVVLISQFRPLAVFSAWLAALAGAWFAVGSVVAARWTALGASGRPVGGPDHVLAEQIGFFLGLGVVIVFVAALALGRFTVIGASDVKAAAPVVKKETVTKPDTEPVREPVGAGRIVSRITPIPVFRGRQRSVETSDS
jgi:hypothetical protein